MYIHEAVEKILPPGRLMTRKEWNEELPEKYACFVLATHKRDRMTLIVRGNDPHPGWEPTAEDLMADDWEVVDIL